MAIRKITFDTLGGGTFIGFVPADLELCVHEMEGHTPKPGGFPIRAEDVLVGAKLCYPGVVGGYMKDVPHLEGEQPRAVLANELLN